MSFHFKKCLQFCAPKNNLFSSLVGEAGFKNCAVHFIDMPTGWYDSGVQIWECVWGGGAVGRDFPLETLLSETTGSLCPDL